MTSFLAEVLSSVEKVELQQVNTKCPEVASSVSSCKGEVLSYLENVYVRFLERPRKNKMLASKINKIQEEVTTLKCNVEHITCKQLDKAESDLSQHLDSLNQMKTEISLISTLVKIHDSIETIKELHQNQSFLLCMQEIKLVEDLFTSLNANEELPVVEELKVCLETAKIQLFSDLPKVFEDHVILNSGGNKSVMTIKKTEVLEEVLSALYFHKNCVFVLDKVTKFLWDSVFVLIVDSTSEIKISNEFTMLEVITVDPNKKSSYIEVFANIKMVLEFLLTNFCIKLSDDLTTLDYIGRDIRDNLSELIIKRCLQDTIPSNEKELKEYNDVIQATEVLEQSLHESKIFAEDTVSLIEYANNIDIHFINKKCQNYITQSQQLMKKDLHDLVEVGEEKPAIDVDVTTGFPKCSISRSVLELQKLLDEILIKATTSSEVCAGRLLCTAKNICQKYATFVPEHHKKLLDTIPQQIAVFYNNCMYIAHQLIKWTNTQIPSILGIGSNYFAEDGRKLSYVASEKFTSYIESQVKQIEEIMKESNLTGRETLDKLDPATEKCIRQCLRQQELLRTVWLKVLPYSIYNKAVGTILNSLCNYLINVIVKFEDISSDAAEQLVELFKMVQTRGPKLFTDPKEISLFVQSWYKMNELAFVLNASLLDINDRWADGKGPLGLQFKAVELKQLIRALFQNTERRAALLEKIRD